MRLTYPFTTDEVPVGTIFMVVAVVSTVGKALLTGLATKHWGEATFIKASALLGSVGFLVLLAANTYVTILLATGFFILSRTLLRPAAFALISRRSAASQGTAMGLSNAFMDLGRVVGPIWAGFIFDVNVDYPYLSGAAVMFIGFLVSLVWVAQSESSASDDSGLSQQKTAAETIATSKKWTESSPAAPIGSGR